MTIRISIVYRLCDEPVGAVSGFSLITTSLAAACELLKTALGNPQIQTVRFTA